MLGTGGCSVVMDEGRLCNPGAANQLRILDKTLRVLHLSSLFVYQEVG